MILKDTTIADGVKSNSKLKMTLTSSSFLSTSSTFILGNGHVALPYFLIIGFLIVFVLFDVFVLFLRFEET